MYNDSIFIFYHREHREHREKYRIILDKSPEEALAEVPK
jgi:hypothetical protein